MSNIEAMSKVDALLKKLSLKEKVEQMYGIKGWHALTPWTYRLNFYRTPDNRRLGIRGLRFTDGPRGINLGRSTAFPVALARGASWDVELEERIGSAMGLEAWHQGANAAGSTCVNVIRHPGWGRAQETYGAASMHLGAMGAALVRGLQKHVIAVVKHYALNSIENSRFKVSVEIEEQIMQEHYLPHFKACVDAGAAGIMSAYNRVNRTFCGEHEHLLDDILRGQWGFDGFVMSDFFLGCRSTAKAIKAGLDMEMPQVNHYRVKKVRDAIDNGELTEADIDRAAARILRVKERFGLIGNRQQRRTPKSVVACETHQKLALESARRSCVLLKNQQQTLPVKAGARVLLVGKLAVESNLGSEGSVSVKPPHADNLLGQMRKASEGKLQVEYTASARKATRMAPDFDAVIICAGLRGKDEGEYFGILGGGGDRQRLELPDEQEETIGRLAAENANTIVVLYGGSAIACGNWADRVRAILMAWYPGMHGGRAVADILLGNTNPQGKLPLSFPAATADLPLLDNSSNRVGYDDHWDFRHYLATDLQPLFPLGHGLSYCEFKLQKMATTVNGGELWVEFELENTGDRDGTEVVQLYAVRPVDSRRSLPVLADFLRLEVKAGQRVAGRMEVPLQRLKRYKAERGEWVLESGPYTLELGRSSMDPDALRAEFELPVQSTATT